MNPAVTVVLDTYNHEEFVADAIRSALGQDFPRSQMEILVVDDGSIDRTPEIVRGFEPQVRLLRKPNGGQASAINFGIAHAKGQVIAFLDGDDVWLPTKVSRVVAEFRNDPNVVLVYHKFVFWNSSDGREWDPKWPLISGDVAGDRRKLQIYSPAPTSSLAFRKSALDRLTPIPERCSYMHDAYLTSAAIFLGPVLGLPEYLTKNRVHENNLWYTENPFPRPEALQRRIEVRRAAIESTRAWMITNVPKQRLPQARELLLLSILARESDEFLLAPPGRIRFARHLLQRAYHFGARISWRHRFVTYANAIGALFTGHSRYHLLDEWRIRIRNAVTGRASADTLANESVTGERAPSEIPAVHLRAPCPQAEISKSAICPGCGAESTGAPLDSFHGSWLFACANCDLHYWHPAAMPDADWYETAYQGRDQTAMPLEPGHRFFLSDPKAPKRGRLLDLGCGVGNFVAAARNAGFDATGIEFDEAAVQFGRRHYGLDRIFAMRAEDFRTANPEQRFDIVTFFEVLEHQDHPQRFLRAASEFLTDQGYAAMSVPNRCRWQKGADTLDYPPNHLTRWSPTALRNFLQSNKFDILTIREEPLGILRAAQVLSTGLRTGLASRLAGGRPPTMADLAEMKPEEMKGTIVHLGQDLKHRLASRLVRYKTLAMAPFATLLLPYFRARGHTGLYLYCLARKR